MIIVVEDRACRTGQPSQVQVEPQLQLPEAQPQLPFMLMVVGRCLVGWKG
jgi:hypothetical protein